MNFLNLTRAGFTFGNPAGAAVGFGRKFSYTFTIFCNLSLITQQLFYVNLHSHVSIDKHFVIIKCHYASSVHCRWQYQLSSHQRTQILQDNTSFITFSHKQWMCRLTAPVLIWPKFCPESNVAGFPQNSRTAASDLVTWGRNVVNP